MEVEMDERIKKVLEREKINKPIMSLRMVGSRVEMHLLGESEFRSYELEEEKKKDPKK